MQKLKTGSACEIGLKTGVCLGCEKLEDENFKGIDNCPCVPKGIELYRCVINKIKNKK